MSMATAIQIKKKLRVVYFYPAYGAITFHSSPDRKGLSTGKVHTMQYLIDIARFVIKKHLFRTQNRHCHGIKQTSVAPLLFVAIFACYQRRDSTRLLVLPRRVLEDDKILISTLIVVRAFL